ncbi:MAG: metalloregulator ArsR/SmtB family transcription factor [Roseococcus sp.]|nr:metalloregulator ArsR/SmtB family transcription factor [Roseococcus sp.]
MKDPIGLEPPLAGMAEKAEEAARLLASLAHGKRLMALCHMLQGERSVGQLAALVGLSPTALSQHLARLRDLGLVETRREGQTIFYRLASPEVRAILETLYRLYCAPEEPQS